MIVQASPARACAPALRQAVRLLDALLSEGSPVQDGARFTFSATLSASSYDSLSLWLVGPDLTLPRGVDPLAAAQREAVRLLRTVMRDIDIIRPLADGSIRMIFVCDDVLHDDLMIWGAAVEDMEVLAEDDEDGADAEPPDHPLDSQAALPPEAPREIARLTLELFAAHPPMAPDHLPAA